MKQRERLDQRGFSQREAHRCLPFRARAAWCWYMLQALFPSTFHPLPWLTGVFSFHHHPQNLFSTLWLSVCLFGDFRHQQQLQIGCRKAQAARSSRYQAIQHLAPDAGSEWEVKVLQPITQPLSQPGPYFFIIFVCFLYSNLLSGCRNANSKRSWQIENN